MDVLLSMFSDLIILIFDLALYIQLTLLKKDNRLYRGLMYGGVIIITAAYVVAAYVFHVPYALASFICMTIPSFLLFLFLSKYKSCRFLVTFCFVDTITLIIASCGKVALVLGGTMGGIISSGVLLAVSIGTYLTLKPYCPQYRELIDRVPKGWGPMAVSTVFIYILLVLSAAYPSPLIGRLEYLPVYLFLCITVLSFYGVFITLIVQKGQLAYANMQLQQQRHWHDLAYLDELTQLANQAAYAARTEELQKRIPHEENFCVILFDIDNFKHINDTHGHHYGNVVLKKTADFFLKNFSKEDYEFFRVGGDEFAAIARNIPEEEIRRRVEQINTMALDPNLGCTYSCGYSAVDFSEEKSFEMAFIEADQAMYIVKNEKKQKLRSAQSVNG